MSPLADDIYKVLRARVPNERAEIHYSDLIVRLPARWHDLSPDGEVLARALGEIVAACRAAGLPALSSIVVRKQPPHVPGAGYYPAAHPEVKDTAEQMIAWATENVKAKRCVYPENI